MTLSEALTKLKQEYLAVFESPESGKDVAELTICLIMPDRSQKKEKDPKSRSWLSPGSLLEVAGMTAPQHRVVIWDELAQGRLTVASLPEADIYGLSGLSTSRHRAYELSAMIRNCGKKVIVGGIDVTGHYWEGHGSELLAHYDSIVVGRLTMALWQQALEELSEGKTGRVYQADPAEPYEFVRPRHDLIQPKRYFFPASIRTSAGCSQSCPFCTVHLVTGGRRVVHCKPGELLEKELSTLPKLPRTRDRLFVCDDSFGADYEHALQVSLPLLKKTGRSWFTEITLRDLFGGNGRPELLGPMKESGCAGVYVGIENPDQPVSAKSLSRTGTENAIKEIHQAGLLVLGSFVLDVTGRETKESIEETVKWIIEQKLDFAQIALLALLPGSAMRERALKEGRVIDNNPDHLDGAWPTIAHSISPEKRIELLQWAYQEIYSPLNIARRLKRISGWQHIPMVVAANWQIYRSSASWAKQFGYKYWRVTRQ